MPPHRPSSPFRPLRIAVDFDGVLFDHVPYVLRGFRDRYGIDLRKEGLRHWDFYRYEAVRKAGLRPGQVERLLNDIESDRLLHLEPPRDPMAVPVLRRWADQGHHVSIVTARHPSAEEATRQFLRHNGVPHHELRMHVAVKAGWDVLVDDAPHNVLAAAAQGGQALLMDHPYNRDVAADGNPLRVHDWLDVRDAVDALAGGRAPTPPAVRARRAA